jgi:hypothetical protein
MQILPPALMASSISTMAACRAFCGWAVMA